MTLSQDLQRITRSAVLDPAEGLVMERVLLEQRRIWFDARTWQTAAACWCTESEGELVMLVDASPAEADNLITEARRRRAFVVSTPFSHPEDLAQRLVQAGMRRVQAQGTYIYRGGPTLPPQPARRGFSLAGLLGARPGPLPVDVETIGLPGLAIWNKACYRAFAPRGVSEFESLTEKTRALRNMGEAGSWYLATHQGQAVGTAIRYQGQGAAIVMAVGTDPRWRGRGIATALMQAIVADHSRQGHGFLFLDTQPGGNAERLYLQLGFVPAYVREVYGA